MSETEYCRLCDSPIASAYDSYCKAHDAEDEIIQLERQLEDMRTRYSKKNLLKAMLEVIYMQRSLCASQNVHGILAGVERELDTIMEQLKEKGDE